MDSNEIKALIEQLKAQGLSEEEIMTVFYETFTKGEMDRKDLETLAEAMGYELTDDFKNEPTPDPIAAGAEGLSKEQLEDAKEIGPDESKEEFKEEIEEAKSDMPEDDSEKEPAPSDEEPKEEEKEEAKVEDKVEDKADGSSEPEESEEDEWEKAQKMFKI